MLIAGIATSAGIAMSTGKATLARIAISTRISSKEYRLHNSNTCYRHVSRDYHKNIKQDT